MCYLCVLCWAKVSAYLLQEQESIRASGGPLHHPAVSLSACTVLVPQSCSVVVSVEFQEENEPTLLHYVSIKEDFPLLLRLCSSSWVLCYLRKWSTNRPVRHSCAQGSLQSVLFFLFPMHLVVGSAPIQQGWPASACCVTL